MAWFVRPFLPGLSWAFVLVCASWPLVEGTRLRHRGWLALLLTLGVAGILIAPLIALSFHAVRAWSLLISLYSQEAAQGWPLPAVLANLNQPWIASIWTKATEYFPSAVSPHGGAWLRDLAGRTESLTLNTLVTLLILFILLRDGTTFFPLLRQQSESLFGLNFVHAVESGARAIRAMFWVIVLVSITEAGALAAVFALASVPHALAFGALAGLASTIPGVTPLVVLGVSAWLFTQHSIWWAIAIAAIGGVLSVVVDHIVRPIFIGRKAGLPVIVALLSMLAGVEAFGLVGLLLGPGIAAFCSALLSGT